MIESATGQGHGAPRQRFAGWQQVLRETPTDVEVLALARPQRVNESFWFLLTRMAAMFSYDRFDLKVSGIEKLPRRGPFLCAPTIKATSMAL